MQEETQVQKPIRRTKATVTVFLHSPEGKYEKITVVEFVEEKFLKERAHLQLLQELLQRGMWRQLSENGLENEYIPFSRMSRVEFKIDEPSAIQVASEAEVPGVAALNNVLEITKNRG